MNETMRDELIDYFWDELTGWDYESWQSAGAKDKEEIVVGAITELGVEVDIDEAYDLFWEWADGLDRDSFVSDEESDEEDIDEEQKDNLIDCFFDGLADWTWESWQASSSVDREAMLVEIVPKFKGIFTEKQIYDIFNEWADDIDKYSFPEYEV